MADEIEKLYLLGKLNELIEQVDKSDKPIPSQIAKLPFKFQKLKKILENELNKMSSSSTKLTKEQLYKLNNLLSEWQSKQHSPFSPESLLFAFTCANALENILVDVANDDTPQSLPQTSQVTVEAYRWSNQYVDEKNVCGVKDKEVFLRRLILPQPFEEHKVVFRMFGLVGMQGIGKTTLAQMVFNHPDIRSHFLPRVWVCVSKQPGDDGNPQKEIVKRVLRSLGVEDEIIHYAEEKHHLKGLLYALRQQLSGKRYLIVLDDVWIEDKEYLNFVSSLDENITKCEEKMAYGLPKEYGGAIIVTSRNKKNAGMLVREENLHSVLPLSNNDCWEIFKNTFKEEGLTVSSDMETLEKKIIEKCHGLPLGAKMMGEIARKPKTIPTETR